MLPMRSSFRPKQPLASPFLASPFRRREPPPPPPPPPPPAWCSGCTIRPQAARDCLLSGRKSRTSCDAAEADADAAPLPFGGVGAALPALEPLRPAAGPEDPSGACCSVRSRRNAVVPPAGACKQKGNGAVHAARAARTGRPFLPP
ncbi:hypothetical protein E2320_009281 [Naja naja]|nr:hypothetical protein E2320_009281 [Naja naja]